MPRSRTMSLTTTNNKHATHWAMFLSGNKKTREAARAWLRRHGVGQQDLDKARKSFVKRHRPNIVRPVIVKKSSTTACNTGSTSGKGMSQSRDVQQNVPLALQSINVSMLSVSVTPDNRCPRCNMSGPHPTERVRDASTSERLDILKCRSCVSLFRPFVAPNYQGLPIAVSDTDCPTCGSYIGPYESDVKTPDAGLKRLKHCTRCGWFKPKLIWKSMMEAQVGSFCIYGDGGVLVKVTVTTNDQKDVEVGQCPKCHRYFRLAREAPASTELPSWNSALAGKCGPQYNDCPYCNGYDNDEKVALLTSDAGERTFIRCKKCGRLMRPFGY